MPRSRIAGSQAENRVADLLAAKGYAIVSRRVKTSRGEIDLIALDGDVLVFVEVKMSSFGFEVARRSLNEDKKSRLFQAAQEYVAKMEHPEFAQRLDVVLVCGDEMLHLENALNSPDVGHGYNPGANAEYSDEPED
jgi:putative endonuclease